MTSSDALRSVSITLPIPPLNNSHYNHGGGRVYLTSESRNFRTLVKYTIRQELLEGPVCLTINYYRPRKAGDIDGPLKECLDALQDVLYKNDNQVVELHVYRGDDKDNPRLEITVSETIPKI